MDLVLKRHTTIQEFLDRFWDNLVKIGKEKVTQTYLKARLALLEDYWQSFKEGHYELVGSDDKAVREYLSSDAYTTTEDNYVLHKSKILAAIKNDPLPARSDDSVSAVPCARQNQLPKINLPKFSGDQLGWETFRDMFRSLVHEVSDMPPVQKLQYLKSCLSGEAADCIANIPLTDAAYDGAWKDLSARYDNRRVLLSAHMRSLLACPAAVKSTSTEIKRVLGVMTHAIRAFTSLGRPVEHWDDWFIHLLVNKLDASTRILWETSLDDPRAFPMFKQLQEFLEKRVRALETANPEASVARSAATANPRPGKNAQVSANSASTSRVKIKRECPLCKDAHTLAYCAKFKALSVAQRGEQARKFGACQNCLRTGHRLVECAATGRCLVCSGKHHTALHGSGPQAVASAAVADTSTAPRATTVSSSLASHTARSACTTLLPTAQVLLQSTSGHTIRIRALLDSGSDATFVAEWVAQTLQVKRKRVNISVAGLQGAHTGDVTSSCSVTIRSPTNPRLNLPAEALILRSLTSLLPAEAPSVSSWDHLRGLPLADETFDPPAKVDAILGADVYGQLIEPAIRRGPQGFPSAQLTVFGWVLTGTLPSGDSTSTRSHRIRVHHARTDELTAAMQRFWEIEELASPCLLSPEESWVEEHFQRTHSRSSSGRYIVRLPQRTHGEAHLGPSRQTALSMLLSSERRLSRQPELKKRYTDFMVEYLALDHMSPIGRTEAIPRDVYYLPHHAIFRSGDVSGRIRVVFNASARTASGYSLNECLLPGPKLQSDLWIILTRWRLYRVGFMADIVKMFRQICIHPEDTDLQRILWRADPSEEVRDFRLTTVTYGTTCAPFLALRTLRQLAEDEAARFPLGADAIRRHSYVDDILAGGDSPETASEIKSQLISLLQAGGFALSKWASNCAGLCPHQEEMALPSENAVGALGVSWDPRSGTLGLNVALQQRTASADLSKRAALAEVARLFDPLGWAASVLIFAKIFIQDLWLSGCGWDDRCRPLLCSGGVSFKRHLLHGFSDASERAYAAAAYLRVADEDGGISVNLLVARTKVAPLKTQSIPRLELCGALLLAKLLRQVSTSLDLPVTSVFAWTDAQVVLCWLRSHASRWKPFVAHRVAQIQDLVPSDQWRYVRTASNPADVATRGVPPPELAQLSIWWHGPPWLGRPSSSWPVERPEQLTPPPEERSAAVFHALTSDEDEILERFSTLSKLLRVTAFCFRFSHNAKGKEPRQCGLLTTAQLRHARTAWIKVTQCRHFPAEIPALSTGRCIPARSSLRSLKPFLDDLGLIRVGGRLAAASLPYGERHPLVLPRRGHFTRLVVRHAHTATLHGGPRVMMSYLARTYWIIGGQSHARHEVRQCVRCTRFRADVGQQQMGQLPPERLTPSRPFLSSGVDYAGPLRIRASHGRGRTSIKGYICLFVCLVTKAIHLEAVSDLSAAAFLAAFRRFISRRGRCTLLLSDNGTNFHGADAELRAMFQAASPFYEDCGASLANDGTTWRFIPPHAPHFGGLWEAGVRSTKHHLKRLLSDHTLTYEELSTLLCQIEACLNSRPLGPLSADPTDLVALSPGHFLVGEPLVSIPEPFSLDAPSSLRNRWHLISNIRNHFWQRWAKEYLHTLLQANRWHQSRRNFQVGDLVLLKDELHPPAKWPLGRILEVTAGPDGLVRIAKIKTASSVLLRPITRLCLLPVESVERIQGQHAPTDKA